jgi:hypothetical protein
MNTKYEHTVNIHTLNVKIVIRPNFDERCFDYHISNINRVEDKEIDFFISYSSNTKTISQATIGALKEICEQYEEYCNQ